MKTNRKLILAAIISLIILIFIILEVNYSGFLVKWDLSLNLAVKSIQNNFLTSLSKIIGVLFDTTSMIVISLIFVIYLWFKNYKKDSIFLIFIMLIDSAAVFVLKEIVQRARPLNSLISESSFAFPSGHTTTSVVFFGFLIYLLFRKNKNKNFNLTAGLVFILISLLIGFTRIYLNLHWLSDVLAGLVLGLFVLASCIIIKEIFE